MEQTKDVDISRPLVERHYVIAEDHTSIRLMVREILESRLGAEPERIDEVKNGEELLQLADHGGLRDHFVVLDLVMPGEYKRVALLKALLQRSPDAKVVAYSGDESPLLALAILKEGAMGYVTKASPVWTLVDAIQAVQAGGKYVDSTLDIAGAQAHPWWRLSETERAVIIEVCRGRALADIAQVSGKAYATLRSQKSDAMRKLGVRSDIELMSFMHDHGLLFELGL